MDHHVSPPLAQKSFRQRGFSPRRAPRAPVEHQISEVPATVVEIGETNEYQNRPPYRLVTIVPHGSDQPEQVVLRGAKAEPHTVMDAVIALKNAGICRFVFKLAAAETWKSRRIESFRVVPNFGGESPVAERAPEAQEQPATPERQALRLEILETKRYNTSDGGDRQVLLVARAGAAQQALRGYRLLPALVRRRRQDDHRPHTPEVEGQRPSP
jgi:hypothetical protein